MMLDKANLPTKPQDFQIRVVVHEARNLFGGNLHPVTNVSIGKQGKHTRVQRSTAKPKWEEVFGSFIEVVYWLQNFVTLFLKLVREIIAIYFFVVLILRLNHTAIVR